MVIVINSVVDEGNKAIIIVDIVSLWDPIECEKEGERLRK